MNSFIVTFLTLILGLGVSHVTTTMPVSEPAVNGTTATVTTIPVTADTSTEPSLGSKGDTLVQESLIAPLGKFNNIEKDMFSRCGSGFYYVYDDSAPVDEYYHGVIWYNVGCGDSNQIAKFRVNKDETVLQVLNTTDKTYISPADWLKIYESGAGKF